MIYFNNAATTYPKPPGVSKAVTASLDSIPFHPGRAGTEQLEKDTIESCRSKLARLLGVSCVDNIIFTGGATEGLNLVLKGLLQGGEHVVTTAIEHNSVLRPLKTLERDQKLKLSIVNCDNQGRINPKDLECAIREETQAVVVSHCSNVTGTVQDLTETGRRIKAHDVLFIVDASQSAGAVPIEAEKWGVDALVCAGHKNLYGIAGVGAVYLSENLAVQPLKVGGTGIRSDYLYQPPQRPMYYEAGTANTPGIAALEAGLDFIEDIHLEVIRDHKKYLRDMMLDFLCGRNEITVYAPDAGEGMISFNIADTDAEECGYILESSFGIVCRAGLHCAPLIHSCLGCPAGGSVRLSFSYFNTEDEIKHCQNALNEIMQAVCI